mmetsp:Transcript_30633/g.49145  ORF Transcript_30633/g.49145 Transcript_30633/m.49145 type:complete len:261 (-) Transcript_30633:689-1471(-)
MGHHGVGSLVKLIVVGEQEDRLLPVVVPLTCLDELGDVELLRIQLDEVHQFLCLVLGIENCKLGVHTDVSALVAEARVQERNKLLERARRLILRNELVEVVRVDNDVHRAHLCTAELLSLDASAVHLLPSLRVVRLLRGLNSLGILTELNVACSELGVGGDGQVENLCGLVRTLVVKSISNSLEICGVGAADELLHLGHSFGLRIGVDKLCVNQLILGLVTGHEQVLHELVIVLLDLCGADHLCVVPGVLGFEVGVDGLC